MVLEGEITKEYEISKEKAEDSIIPIKVKAFSECFDELREELYQELEMGYSISFRFETDWWSASEDTLIYKKTLKYICLKQGMTGKIYNISYKKGYKRK